ncbi:MAG: response regulator transcription factor [Steroidobacteraceae bacterium]|nr:response regulator transcription factor [Steroidobacteraceae bacterium]
MRSLVYTILVYGVILAAGAFGLQFIEYQYLVRHHATETYVVIVALAFMFLGVWVGLRLFRSAPAPRDFVANTQAQTSLGISARELEVLRLLATGQSNKEIANRLTVSPNTVKTHISNLFAKLEVRRRTAAIGRARELGIID